MPPSDENNTILTALSESDENAGVSLFIALLRTTPILLHWLRIAALTPPCFERLSAVVERRLEPPAHARVGYKLLAWLAWSPERGEPTELPNDGNAAQPTEQKMEREMAQKSEREKQETAFLRQQIAPVVAPTYGGLTARQTLALVRRYQAGNIDASAFLLAHAWWEQRKPRPATSRSKRKRSSPANSNPVSSSFDLSNTAFRKTDTAAFSVSAVASRASVSSAFFAALPPRPSLLRATILYLQMGLTEDHPLLLHHLALAADFFHGHAPGGIGRAHFGHAAWWRLQLLHYMLRHPKPAYRIGEFVAHLQSRRLTVDPKDIRRFCLRHSIARDTSPGRPKHEGEGWSKL